MRFIPYPLQKKIEKDYPIQTGINNPILRKKSTKIDIVDKKIINFMKLLHNAQILYDGVWLASPQIWKNIRIVSIAQLDNEWKKILFYEEMINPEIIEYSDTTNIDLEGCLSLPGLEANVERYDVIKVKYLNKKWEEKIMEAEMMNARIIQHEIDHLDGILYWDKKLDD